MKDLVDIQWDWVNWLIKSRNGREWLDTHINSPTNIQRLHRIIIHRQYDSVSGFLLNYLLTEFQKDESIKSKWVNDMSEGKLIRRR
jgi:hypothetical protein